MDVSMNIVERAFKKNTDHSQMGRVLIIYTLNKASF